LGIPNLAVREIAATNARNDWAHMRGFIARAHQAIGVLTLVPMAVAAAILFVWAEKWEPVKLQSMAVALILLPLVSLGALRGAMLRGLRKVVLGQLPEHIFRPVTFLVLILLMMLVAGNFMSPVGVIALRVAATALAFLGGLYLFLRHRPPELADTEPRFTTSIWLKSSIPFGLTAGLQLINGRTDILLLGIFRPDAEVGIYNVAVQIAALVIFGLRVVNAIQAPHIAHLYAEGDMQRLQKMITKSSRAVLTTTVPIVLVIMVFGDEIIRIAFGGEYRGAYIPLVILSVGQLINASMGSVANLLNMTGHERDTTRSIFIGAVVNLTLGISLTPNWGMTGAAIATAATLVTWNVVMWRKVYLRLGIETSPFYRRRTKESTRIV
jgi:O-antigen/teichoic acid export membrane protein